MAEVIDSSKINRTSRPGALERLKSYKLLIIILLVAVVAVIAYVLSTHNSSSSTSSPSDNLALSSYSYKGEQAGTGMSFLKPDQFNLTSATTAKLTKIFTWSNSGVINGSIFALSAPYSASSDRQSLLSSQKDLTGAPDSQAYQTAATAPTLLSRVWLTGVNAKYATQVQTATPINLANANGWLFPIKVTLVNKPPNTSVWSGQFIYIVGKNAAYYFGVATTNAKWQQDTAIWRQVENSLKIDQ